MAQTKRNLGTTSLLPPTNTVDNSLASLLRDKPSDETGGIEATIGLTFQQWWATLKATELYVQGKDFAIGMEIKEDVAVLDCPHNPTLVEFYQIKKYEREGVWTWSELLQASKKKTGIEPSTLAKLYSRRHAFSGHSTKLTFVSNLGFKVPLDPAAKGKLQHSSGCGLHEFVPKNVSEVLKKLSDQLGIPQASIDLTNFHLQQTHLPLGDQHTYLTGMLSKLSDTGKFPFKITKPHVSAMMLAAEFQQRANSKDYANTYAKLKARCLSKAEMTRVLGDVENAGPSIQQALEEGLNRLDREDYHYGRMQQIERQKIMLCADITDRTNVQAKRLCELFLATKAKIEKTLNELPKLGSMIEALAEEVSSSYPVEIQGLDKYYLYGISILVIKNAIKLDLYAAAVNSQSKE